MAQSPDLAAYDPSLPLIPIPMWACMIIGTSFAPSPIDMVTHLPFFYASATTSDFYLGDTLQQMTELALIAQQKNASPSLSSSSAYAKVCPSITIPTNSLSFSSSFFLKSSSYSLPMNSFLLSELRITISILVSSRILHDLPISMAVSCLSPVRTQSLMLALRIFLIVEGTSSWRRSSMAVLPRYSSPYSSSSQSKPS